MPVSRNDATSGRNSSSMDTQLNKPRKPWFKYGLIASLCLVGLVAAYEKITPNGGRSLQQEQKKLVISEVMQGQFEDYIQIRGNVEPLRTLFLDVTEGGNVEAIHVENGAEVTEGQLLVEFSNPSVQLQVITAESRVTEQLNSSRTQELQLEQNRLQHKRTIADAKYQIALLENQLKKREKLIESGHISKEDIETLRINLNYQKTKLEIELESQTNDAKMQGQQLEQLRKANQQMIKNLEIARKSVEGLSVRAQISGRLTAFNLKLGENVNSGDRIGKIDDPSKFKLSANLNEFYLNRVDIDQTVEVNVGGESYELKIKKINPVVSSGQFNVEMFFSAEVPAGIRRGQTLQGRLQLGDSNTSLLVKNGAFFQDSGGNWAFVLNPEGTIAERRKINLGRRNPKYIEVLGGLNEGERIVISSYSNFKEIETLKINK